MADNITAYFTVPYDKFVEMMAVDVSKFTSTDQKGLTYLSWQGATLLLKQYFPNLQLQYTYAEDGTPGHRVEQGDGSYTSYVEISLIDVVSGARTVPHYFPCYKAFGAVNNPTAYHYNTAIVRGYARLVAITTGLGFGLYLGDDTDIQEVSGGTTRAGSTSEHSAPVKSPAGAIKRQTTVPGLDY